MTCLSRFSYGLRLEPERRRRGPRVRPPPAAETGSRRGRSGRNGASGSEHRPFRAPQEGLRSSESPSFSARFGRDRLTCLSRFSYGLRLEPERRRRGPRVRPPPAAETGSRRGRSGRNGASGSEHRPFRAPQEGLRSSESPCGLSSGHFFAERLCSCPLSGHDNTFCCSFYSTTEGAFFTVRFYGYSPPPGQCPGGLGIAYRA